MTIVKLLDKIGYFVFARVDLDELKHQQVVWPQVCQVVFVRFLLVLGDIVQTLLNKLSSREAHEIHILKKAEHGQEKQYDAPNSSDVVHFFNVNINRKSALHPLYMNRKQVKKYSSIFNSSQI